MSLAGITIVFLLVTTVCHVLLVGLSKGGALRRQQCADCGDACSWDGRCYGPLVRVFQGDGLQGMCQGVGGWMGGRSGGRVVSGVIVGRSLTKQAALQRTCIVVQLERWGGRGAGGGLSDGLTSQSVRQRLYVLC